MKNNDPERMACMEVWGGNHAVERNFQTPGLKIWVYSRPYRQAAQGGDVYYLSSCASGRITRMLLADVMGHGQAAAQVAVNLRESMRRNVNYIKQTRFVRAMNQQFTEFGDCGGFATALVSTFFAPTQSFAFCNAGHPAPFIFRQATSTWTQLDSDSNSESTTDDAPLGIFGEADYRQRQLRLNTGDMVLSFSDAVTESLTADRRQLGQEGTLRLVRELDPNEPNHLISGLLERIKSRVETNLEQDDATLLLCQATGTGPSLRDNLLAPFRLLKRPSDRTKLG